MSDTVVEKAAAVTPDLQSKAVELIDQLTAGLKAVAPQMADVTLAAIRAEAISSLLLSALWSVAWVAGCIAFYRLVRKGLQVEPIKKTDYQYIANEYKAAVRALWMLWTGGVGIVVSSGLLIINLSMLTSRIDWITAFDPRLGLALRVINKLM